MTMTEVGALRMRRAGADDRGALEGLQRDSMSRLAKGYYTRRQLEAFFAAPAFRLHDVLEAAELWVLEGSGGLVACAAWRAEPDGAALVRSVFVHGDWARRGLAGRLMDHVESRAGASGAHEARLVSTLSGAPFYRARGYVPLRPHRYDLGGVAFAGVEMAKPLAGRQARPSAA